MGNHTAEPQKLGQIISAALLVGGTCIGGGMLALPLATGVVGFVPSMIMMLICWMAMTATGLLLVEASLWMPEGSHIISMADRFLGPWGRRLSWLLYLFICYASVVAYTAGGGVQMQDTLAQSCGIFLSKAQACALFLVVFGLVIYTGTAMVGRVNALLFAAMIGAYLLLLSGGLSHVKAEFLQHRRWTGAWLSIPLLLTAFSHQTMVPSLTPFLKNNVSAIRKAVIAGTSIAFVVYFVWEMLILGIVPVGGDAGLNAALAEGRPATQFLAGNGTSDWVVSLGEFFAFFALVTSFLGMSLGLYDFLSDGLHIEKKGWGKVWLGILIAVPTFFFASYFERIFLLALDTTGGFGDALLSGIIPVLMVWKGRYFLGLKRHGGWLLGRGTLVLLIIFYLGAVVVEMCSLLGCGTSTYDTIGTLD